MISILRLQHISTSYNHHCHHQHYLQRRCQDRRPHHHSGIGGGRIESNKATMTKLIESIDMFKIVIPFKAARETKANHKRNPSNVISNHQKLHHPTILSMLRVFACLVSVYIVYTCLYHTHHYSPGWESSPPLWLPSFSFCSDMIEMRAIFHDANATCKKK